MTCGVCTYQWCWICNGDYFYSHCGIKKGYDLLVPSFNEGLLGLLLFSLFVTMTPMILCAGVPIAVFVLNYGLFYEWNYENNDY